MQRPGEENHEPATRVCDFCAQPQKERGRLVAGPGITICERCVKQAAELLHNRPRHDRPSVIEPQWTTMTDQELLGHLPEIAAVADQVEKRLGQWVAAARERRLTWTAIGSSLGMTRQSAWERFRT